MVTVTSNSGVRVSKKNSSSKWQMVNFEYFCLSSGNSEMQGSKKVYFSTVKGIYLNSCYYLDEVWSTTDLTSP